MLRRSTEPHPVSIATARGGIKKARMHSTKHFALQGIIQYVFENYYRSNAEELYSKRTLLFVDFGEY